MVRIQQDVASLAQGYTAANRQRVAREFNVAAVCAVAGGGDLRRSGQGGLAVTLQHDVAARGADLAGVGIEGAGVGDVTAGGGQVDVPAVGAHGLGFDQTRVVDHGGLEGIGDVGRHDDGAAV